MRFVCSPCKFLYTFILISFWTKHVSSSKCSSSSTRILKNSSPLTTHKIPPSIHVIPRAASPITSYDFVSRGGGVSMWTPQTQKELSGALVFVLLDKLFRSYFTAKKLAFPSQLGGCIILLTSLITAEVLKPGLGEMVFQALSPGAGWLAKWLPVFFVPGLAGLPLAPSIGDSLEVCSYHDEN